MATHVYQPVEMHSLPGSPTMSGTYHKTHTSILDPLTGRNYPKDIHTMSFWLIVIAIITFFITLIVNIFFVYVPIARMEEKFDTTVEKLDDVASVVKDTAEGAETIIKDVEELGKIAVAEFDKVKAGICAWLRAEGIDFPFCGESNVNEILAGSRGSLRSGSGSGLGGSSSSARRNRSVCP